MTDRGKVNYEAYRKLAGRPGVSAAPLPAYGQLPAELRYAFDAGALAVETWLADAPVDEDMPGNEPEPRYALVEIKGFRRVYGTVTEVTFLGQPMLEVTGLDTGAVQLVPPSSLHDLIWLTRDQAERATRTGAHSVAAIAAADAGEFAGSGPQLASLAGVTAAEEAAWAEDDDGERDTARRMDALDEAARLEAGL